MLQRLLRAVGYRDRAWGDWAVMPHDAVLYRVIERLRVAHAPHGSVLDVGCGPGHLLGHLATPVRYLGIDLQPAALRIASERCGADQRVVCRDATRAATEVVERFDVIVFAEMLYYQPSVDDALRLLDLYRAHLAPGGVFIVSVWSDARPDRLLNRAILRAVEARYRDAITARQTILGTTARSRWDVLAIRP